MSTVRSSGIKTKDLAALAKDVRKDTYDPIAIVKVSDMTYGRKSDGTMGWTYTRRSPTKWHRVTRTLSAVENDAEELKDKEYIPLNTRLEDTDYQYNRSIVYWTARSGWRTENISVDSNLDNIVFEDQRVPYRFEVPEQVIDHYNP